MELMIPVLLHRTDDGEWSASVLGLLRKIKFPDVTPLFSSLGAGITLHDGSLRKVCFEEIDGNHRSLSSEQIQAKQYQWQGYDTEDG